MSIENITSRANPLISRVRRLAGERAVRREEGVFLGEGPKLLGEALKWNAQVECVLFAHGTVLPPLPEDIRQVALPIDLFQSIALTQNPQGVLFICKGNCLELPDKLVDGRYLVLDGLQDPGNIGTIWRTADAFQASGLVLVNQCADPWNPKTIRATMGACFRLPLWETDLPTLKQRLSQCGLPLYATALCDDTIQLSLIDLSRSATIIGSEGCGVSSQALELSERTLKIPMNDRCESLNAAVAASIILWEGFRN